MGSHASASLVYGIDLGDREAGDELVTLPDDFEDGVYEAIDDLRREFRVHKFGPEPDSDKDREAWLAWYRSLTVDTTSYGYDYSGTVLYVSEELRSSYEAVRIDPAALVPDPEAVAELEEFVSFLESKGFTFEPAARKAGWLLTSLYG